MNSTMVIDLFRHAFLTAFWISLPLLAVGFVIGVVISLIQIITSMQDASFSTVPRLVAFLAGLVLLLPWMLARMITYTVELLGDFTRYAH